MGISSKIQWTQHTYNPWHGCLKISSGCKFCYMYRDKERYGQDPWVVVKSKGKFYEPLKWKDPALVFTCSWSDFFIEEADAWRPEVWEIIKKTPHLTYQILTKRPERIVKCLPPDWGNGYDNVWIGISAEDQLNYNKRSPYLHAVKAKVKFISMEPLIGSLKPDFEVWPVDWVIIGGESGNDTGSYLYRPCQQEWIETILAETCKHRVPVFVKQLGTYLSKQLKLSDRHAGEIDEFPKHFQIRQFPKIFNYMGA